MVIAVAGAEPQANAATAAISGSFVNPSPAKDPDQLPYIYTGSQYSGVGTGSFTYGVPIDDQRNALVDPQFRFYADSDGHLLQDLDGSIIQWTQDDVDGGGIKVVRPDQIGQYGSRLTFSGNPSVNGVLGRPFTLGYLTFQNGTTSLGNVDSIDLSLASSSLDGQFNHHLNLRIGIITTPNQGVDRYADADFIYFPDYPQAGSFRVFEDELTQIKRHPGR